MFTVTLCMSSIDLDNARETREFKTPKPGSKNKKSLPHAKKEKKRKSCMRICSEKNLIVTK